MATQKEVDELRAQIERLQTALESKNKQNDELSEMAKAMAHAGQFFASTSEEQPTGRSIKVKRCANPHERDKDLQRWVTIELPTYYFNIQLPAGAGLSLSTNGIEYFHGETYEFDVETLAEIKSRIARCWDHEKSIHGDNENAYRRPANKHLLSKAAAQRGAH